MKDITVMIGEVKFNFRVGLIIEKEDKILIEINPDFDFVCLPGGRVKTLENSKDALIREMKEEMGILFDKKELVLKSIIENFFELENQKIHELFYVYKIKLSKNDNRIYDNMKNIDSKENYYKWINKKELDKINLVPVSLISLKQSDEFESIFLDTIKK